MRSRLFAMSLVASLMAALGCHIPPPPDVPVPQPATAAAVPDAPWRVAEPPPAASSSGAGAVLLSGGRLLLGDGSEIADGHVLIVAGKIASVGAGPATPPANATVIDTRGKVITPGLIDTHSHLGVYPAPRANAHLDGNEMTTPITAGARAVDAVWVQDPGFQRALAGGVTTLQILPGSGNLIGGNAVTIKLREATAARQMQLAGAPPGLKMACGENPKRVYGNQKKTPMTRMGNLALQRDAFMRAHQLIREWNLWRQSEQQRMQEDNQKHATYLRERELRQQRAEACASGEQPDERCQKWRQEWSAAPLVAPLPTVAKPPPARDLDLETLAGAIEGTVLVHVHCYRSDDMGNMLALADEAGFAIRSFHHALEAYKIRRLLSERQIAVSTWADWWGFKLEAYDGIPENLALVAMAGGRAVVHSDSAEGIRRLNQEAAKGLWAGKHQGMDLDEAEATRWITSNPAWALGIHERTGTLRAGLDGDVVVWDQNPFSVYASAERVFVDGVERYRRGDDRVWSDFEAAP